MSEPQPTNPPSQEQSDADRKREKKREQMRRWQANNREKLRKYAKEYREKNKDRVQGYGRKSYHKLKAQRAELSEGEQAAYRKKMADKKRRVRKKNPALYRAANDRWFAKNREKHLAWLREYNCRWREKNRERFRCNKRAWRLRHRERLNQEVREQRAKETPEERATRLKRARRINRKCHIKFRKKYALRRKVYYRLNCEAIKEHAKQYRQTEHGRNIRRVAGQRRRARKLAAGGRGVTFRQWEDILKTFSYRCFWCGCRLHAKNLTMDHLVSFARGGQHDVTNVAPACRPCNFSKQDSDPLEFMEEVLSNPPPADTEKTGEPF